MTLRLSFACGPYDRMEALRGGEVAVAGIELDYIPIQAPREIFDRMVGSREFDMSELSLSEFIALRDHEDCPFVALPVFPSRAFRHGFICINAKAGIDAPADLSGRRIGVPLYTMTAAIWQRGTLAHEYGVDLDSITWVQGAVEKVFRALDLPRRKDIDALNANLERVATALERLDLRTESRPERPLPEPQTRAAERDS